MSRILEGKRSVLEAIEGKGEVHRIYLKHGQRASDVRKAASQNGIAIEERSRAQLDQISESAHHQGIVATASDYLYTSIDAIIEAAQPAPLILALDQINDPQNLGSMIRSASAFGFHGLIIQKHRAASVTTAVVRASAGATEHTSISRVINLQKALQSLHALEIIGLDAHEGVDLNALPPTTTGRVLVVGSEGRGLRPSVRQRCDTVVHIHQEGPMDSLNASVASAIAMYQIARPHWMNSDE